ncbi:MAG: sulfite exporter TauE/SafE family protein [Syntrophobacterales bacterium]|nr:sulfite exporter TauE/SafE family protein [Syntrophobacterales bacterium]
MFEQLFHNLALQLNESFFLAPLIAYLGGLLVGLTPCVYPVIPVTVAFIGASSVNSRTQSFFLSLFYVLGIALTYTALGIFASLSGMLFGQIQSNPWTYFIMANICLLMALSMFDVFQLPMYAPKAVSRFQARKKTEGWFRSLLLGILSGFVLGPCTTPVLAVLLTYVASKQSIVFGSFLLFLFSLGMGTLLILIGTFAGLLARLPKSGAWMTRISRLLGWVMIGAAQYFLILAGSFWI